LTLDSEKLMSLGVADFEFVPEKLPPLTTEELATQKYPVNKTPLIQIQFFKELPSMIVDTYKMNWQTRFVSFLALPSVSSVLLLILMVCGYLEISTGGFGVPAAVGLIALFFMILSSFALEAISVLEPILFLFGLFLACLEIFFFPTLGLLGIVGACLMLVGLLGMLIPGLSSISYDGTTLNAAGDYVLMRLSWLSGALVVGFAIILYLSRYTLPKFKVVQRIVLGETPMLKNAGSTDTILSRKLVGKTAKVTSALRPAGKVEFDNEDYDAISTGSFIPEGTLVRIIKVEGTKIIVEEMFE
jgi:membrane-bound serine protease (ClpP class)